MALPRGRTTPIQWQHVAPVPFMLLSYPVEWYIALQRDYLPFLPKPSRDLESLQPAVFNYANLHVIYDDSRARDDWTIALATPLSRACISSSRSGMRMSMLGLRPGR